MKKHKKTNEPKYAEIIMPFAGKESEADEDGYFDDCPLCRDMKEMEKKGLIEVFKSDWESPIN